MNATEQQTVDAFHRLFYRGSSDGNGAKHMTVRWMGVPCCKNPLDLWLYQEMVYAHRPDLIIETGTFEGGTTLFLADVMDRIDHGQVITVDINEEYDHRPKHDRISYAAGSSIEDGVLVFMRSSISMWGHAELKDTVWVILDSDHSAEHVLAELRAYGPMVSPGGYLIVEDTNIGGHPIEAGHPGPMEAVETFLAETDEFEVDPVGDKYLFTYSPRGWLRRRDA